MAKVRRPASEWARLIDEWRRSGLSLPAFRQRHGLKRGTMQNRVYKPSFKHALDKARPSDAPGPGSPPPPESLPAFLPIRVTGVTASPPPGRSCVEVILGAGRRIAVGSGFDPETLRRVVAALEGRPC
jgi:hypothetical protein